MRQEAYLQTFEIRMAQRGVKEPDLDSRQLQKGEFPPANTYAINRFLAESDEYVEKVRGMAYEETGFVFFLRSDGQELFAGIDSEGDSIFFGWHISEEEKRISNSPVPIEIAIRIVGEFLADKGDWDRDLKWETFKGATELSFATLAWMIVAILLTVVVLSIAYG